MKIGYPCINRSIGCSSGKTFRLKSYSDSRVAEILEMNLLCLKRILEYNAAHSIRFFRVTSDLVPFASHPVCRYPWQEKFASAFSEIGSFIHKEGIRVSMHPDQFTLINSPDQGVHERSVAELKYHAEVLDLMGLDTSAKIQVHVGGVYGDRSAAMERFIARYLELDSKIKRRLVVENDDRLYGIDHCMELHRRCGVPVLFDSFHHIVFNSGETVADAVSMAASTWDNNDGLLMTDYSSQKPGGRSGSHAESIDLEDFTGFLALSSGTDFDLMLEIKDKEQSAAMAIEIARTDPRFIG